MNRKLTKIQIVSPFQEIANNWKLIHQIESSLNQYLSHPHIFTNLQAKQDSERLGKHGIQQLVIIAKQLLHYVEVLRSEHKTVEAIKMNAAAAQEKLEQHDQIIRNHEKKYMERTKAMVQQLKILKDANERNQSGRLKTQEAFRASLDQAKVEIVSLKEQVHRLENQKKNLLEVINNFQEEITSKNEIISRLQMVSSSKQNVKALRQKLEELQQIRIQRLKKPQFSSKENEFNGPPLEKLGMRDISALSKLLSFLLPSEILQFSLANKRIRLLCTSQRCIKALCGSVIEVKNRKIAYYHRHINYFEKLCQKMPEELIQMAYFRCHILKEPAGQEIMQALNASSLIFEGRFEGEQLYTGLPDFNKEIPGKLPFEEATLLQVDRTIVEEFKQQRKQERDRLAQHFEQMYSKIKTTYELYRADEESSTLFMSNTLKHFSRVFVLAKALYLQVQHIQGVNCFLLTQLNKWDRMQIDKNLQLQDLRAELQAQRKLKFFFTDKSIKSQQKALLEQNLKLTYEMKHSRLNDLMNITCAQKNEFAKKNDALSKANQKLNGECRQFKKLYDITREKYNHVIEELVVVKETIIKMNII